MRTTQSRKLTGLIAKFVEAHDKGDVNEQFVSINEVLKYVDKMIGEAKAVASMNFERSRLPLGNNVNKEAE